MEALGKDYVSPTLSDKFYDNLEDILCEVDFVKKNKNLRYANVSAVFDIEASSFYEGEKKRCCMYAWVFGINGRCIRGRTWGEFVTTINKVVDHYEIDLSKRLIVYIHNLSYEFQWFKDYFSWENVFSIDSRKPIYAVTKSGIEFRCSYLLSGYSLEVLGENLTKYKVKKMVGDLDYSLIRHTKTPLTNEEWKYVLNDGLVVMAHIQEEIERLGSIVELPITNTGYVRDLCRKKCLQGENKFEYGKIMKTLTMTVEDYQQLKRTYWGGFTHANVNYVDRVMHNVSSYDFTSSYPAVMLSEKYPMSKPFKVDVDSYEEFYKYLNSFCCMFDITFYNLRAKVRFENYISFSKCFDIENYCLNNGRVINATKLTTSLTEQDFFIIEQMYDWDYIDIYNFKCFHTGYLPKDFILTILELYEKKTTLKDVTGKEVEYLVSKGMLNSCYGMCVTDPCRDEILYEDGEWSVEKADINQMINRYNTNNNRYLYYAWGIWVTAYARRNLFSGILEFRDDYIYSDTDSIKVLNIENHLDYIEKYNKNVTKKVYKCLQYYNISKSRAHPKTIKGVEKPIGVWDYEGRYNRFKTLGAKRYLYEKDGEITITVAGVNKRKGKKFLVKTSKNNNEIFDKFEQDLYFPPKYVYMEKGKEIEDSGSGKLCHTYIDNNMKGEVIDYMGNKYKYKELSGVHMEPTDYTLGLDHDFIKLINGVHSNHII